MWAPFKKKGFLPNRYTITLLLLNPFFVVVVAIIECVALLQYLISYNEIESNVAAMYRYKNKQFLFLFILNSRFSYPHNDLVILCTEYTQNYK